MPSGSNLLRWMNSRNNSSDARPICQNLLEKGYILPNIEPDAGKTLFDESEAYRAATTEEMTDIRMTEDYKEHDTVVSSFITKCHLVGEHGTPWMQPRLLILRFLHIAGS